MELKIKSIDEKNTLTFNLVKYFDEKYLVIKINEDKEIVFPKSCLGSLSYYSSVFNSLSKKK